MPFVWNKSYLGVLACAVLGGCIKVPPHAAEAPPGGIPDVKESSLDLNADAGVPLVPKMLPTVWVGRVAAFNFVPRKDPFELLDIEKGFEYRQQAERFVNESGGFHDEIQITENPVVEATTEVVEPQPHRRLAGIVVSDSVYAIIEMGDGKPAELVRPGQKIGNTEWTVISIDQEKAVIHRDGNKLPHDVTVRLESRPR
ncbi:MAG: hypothetical protein JSS72_05245 [Armatimonadetes bacterium]|nr:hypothetical protein [Armatimonadota bacterium]